MTHTGMPSHVKYCMGNIPVMSTYYDASIGTFVVLETTDEYVYQYTIDSITRLPHD